MSQEIEDLKALLIAFIDAAGFDIDNDKIGNAESYKITKRVKAKPVPKSSKNTAYSEIFEKTWKIYPKREGGNSKIEAYSVWKARLKDAKELVDEESLMFAGTKRYAEFVTASGNDGTKYVKAARTFFGINKHYMDLWELPKIKFNALKLPAMDTDLESFTNKHNLSKARKGEKYNEWRKRLQIEVAIINAG